MDLELKKHLKRLEKYAYITSLLIFLLIGFFLTFIVLLYCKSKYCLIIGFLFFVSVIFLYKMNKKAKEGEKGVYNLVRIKLPQALTYEEMNVRLQEISNGRYICLNENLSFYEIVEKLELHIVTYQTEDFVKKEYDTEKRRINRVANKQFAISQKVSYFDSGKLMRYNIIYTENINDVLYKLISRNASHNLNRVEGVVNMIMTPNEIIMPPLYGRCDVGHVSRYKRTINFMCEKFLE